MRTWALNHGRKRDECPNLEWGTIMQIPPKFSKNTAQNSPQYAISSEKFISFSKGPIASFPDPPPVHPIVLAAKPSASASAMPRILPRFMPVNAYVGGVLVSFSQAFIYVIYHTYWFTAK